MSIFDVLTNGTLGSVLETITNQAKTTASSMRDNMPGSMGDLGSMLESIGGKAKNVATNIRDNTPGGLGGLAGAGAIGAILGNVLQGDLMKSVAMAGAGAVAWNFYKKWAEGQQGQNGANAGQAAPQGMPSQNAPSGWSNMSDVPPQQIDPTAELVMRAMIYAARADGTIDAIEMDRIHQIMRNMLPGQNVDATLQRLSQESIDPTKIAQSVFSPEQGQDIYRLSCAVIDIDHFMELSYLEALSKALGLSAAQKQQLENEALQAKTALRQSIGQ